MDIKIIRELYAVTIYAERRGQTVYGTRAGACNIGDFYEFNNFMYGVCKKTYPLEEGWGSHQVTYEKLSDDFIKSAIQLVPVEEDK
jgi:hypothetical protein